MQLKYCKTLDFEADSINKFKILIIKTSLFDFKINYISFYNAIKILPKLGFEADPINKIKTFKIKTILFDFKFPYITQLKYRQKLVFEAGPLIIN